MNPRSTLLRRGSDCLLGLAIVAFAFLLSLAMVYDAFAESEGVSIDQIAVAIESHIAAKAKADGGYFRLLHQGQTLELKLIRVHMEYLADLGNDLRFACVDLVGTEGPVYDVDFFLRGKAGAMSVTETTVHKVNGQPLYAWENKKDVGWVRGPVTDATPRALGVIQGPDDFEFSYRVHLPPLAGPARIWLPLARSDAFQQVEILGRDIPGEPRELAEKLHGNRVLYLEAGPKDGGRAIEIRYRVRRLEVSPYPVKDNEDLGVHLAPELLVPDRKDFHDIARKLIGGKTTDLMRARALYDHIIDQVRYARYGEGWGQGDAVNACNTKSGNCTDFHAYFIALARAAGIPARFAIGAAIPSERDEGGIDGYHCWAEFHADERWWPVDISEADKNSSLASYYFGHQPGNRFEFSRGRDLVVDPLPASGPINFLAYPVIEVEGRPVKARTEFLFERKTRH